MDHCHAGLQFGAAAVSDPNRLARLNERQRQVLRLYYRNFSVKEIARELKLSPHTVNEHLRDARRVLGVARSMQAARTLIAYEGDNLAVSKPIGGDFDLPEANKDRAVPVREPAGPVRKYRYRLTGLQRLGLIVAIAFAAVALAGALIAAADTITRVFRTSQIDISDPPYRK